MDGFTACPGNRNTIAGLPNHQHRFPATGTRRTTLDTPSLQVFISVADTDSFTAAGEQLFLTQPAISKRIAQLEEQLGARLFDRIGRQIHLTEAGQALLPRARAVLREMEDISRSITNLSGRVAGKLRIGTSHHIGLHRLPPILRQFSRQYPDVQLDIHFIDSEEGSCYY